MRTGQHGHSNTYVSHLEHLISRYLDGELTPGELRELHRRLDRSPEARALLREMTAVTRSARGIPSLDTPPPALEARLFHRLHAEGLGQNARPIATASSMQATERIRSRSFGRPAVALLLIVFLSLTATYWLSDATRPAAVTVAEATATYRGAPRAIAPRSSDIAQTPSSAPFLASDQASIWKRRSIAPNRNRTPGERRASSRMSPGNLGDPIGASRVDPNSPSDPNAPDARVPTPLPYQESNPIAQAPAIPLDPLVNIPPIERMPELPTPGRQSVFAASFRPTGFSFVGNQQSSPDLSVRFDARIGRDDQISFIVGRSSVRAEQTATALIASSPAIASSDGSPGRTVAPDAMNNNPEPSTSVQLENETWGGIGYSHTLTRLGPVEMAMGARAGVGSISTRFGLEGSVRYAVSEIVSFECVPTVTHIIPHDQTTTPVMLEDISTGTLSFGQSKHSTFTAVGVEFGVRVSIR